MHPTRLLFSAAVAVLACGQPSPKQAVVAPRIVAPPADHAEAPIPAPAEPGEQPSIPDTFPRTTAEDYPVTDAILWRWVDLPEKESGGWRTNDMVLFGNDSLHQTLAFSLYTDLHRAGIYHVNHQKVPLEVINRFQLSGPKGTEPTPRQRQKAFPGFLYHNHPLPARYFQSTKGLHLGDSLSKAVRLYGAPDAHASTTDGYTCYTWEYVGEQLLPADYAPPAGKPIVQNSYGQSIALYFRHDSLMAVAIENMIP